MRSRNNINFAKFKTNFYWLFLSIRLRMTQDGRRQKWNLNFLPWWNHYYFQENLGMVFLLVKIIPREIICLVFLIRNVQSEVSVFSYSSVCISNIFAARNIVYWLKTVICCMQYSVKKKTTQTYWLLSSCHLPKPDFILFLSHEMAWPLLDMYLIICKYVTWWIFSNRFSGKTWSRLFFSILLLCLF